jgi:hypothetical protein
MTKVKWPFFSLTAHGKTSCPVDDSDFTLDDSKFIGLENGKALLQEDGKKIELEWYYKAIYREQPCWFGRITIREKYYTPFNPNSTPQQENRQLFADAVAAWQALSFTDQVSWNKLLYPTHMSGYNRFLRNYLITH